MASGSTGTTGRSPPPLQLVPWGDRVGRSAIVSDLPYALRARGFFQRIICGRDGVLRMAPDPVEEALAAELVDGTPLKMRAMASMRAAARLAEQAAFEGFWKLEFAGKIQQLALLVQDASWVEGRCGLAVRLQPRTPKAYVLNALGVNERDLYLPREDLIDAWNRLLPEDSARIVDEFQAAVDSFGASIRRIEHLMKLVPRVGTVEPPARRIPTGVPPDPRSSTAATAREPSDGAAKEDR